MDKGTFYRNVMVFVCGGSAVASIIALGLLSRDTIGARKRKSISQQHQRSVSVTDGASPLSSDAPTIQDADGSDMNRDKEEQEAGDQGARTKQHDAGVGVQDVTEIIVTPSVVVVDPEIRNRPNGSIQNT